MSWGTVMELRGPNANSSSVNFHCRRVPCASTKWFWIQSWGGRREKGRVGAGVGKPNWARKTWQCRQSDRWPWQLQQTGGRDKEMARASLRLENTFCSFRNNAVPLSWRHLRLLSRHDASIIGIPKVFQINQEAGDFIHSQSLGLCPEAEHALCLPRWLLAPGTRYGAQEYVCIHDFAPDYLIPPSRVRFA